MGRELVRG
jgi:hypothetical protein